LLFGSIIAKAEVLAPFFAGSFWHRQWWLREESGQKITKRTKN